jgi:hypothetical protein
VNPPEGANKAPVGSVVGFKEPDRMSDLLFNNDTSGVKIELGFKNLGWRTGIGGIVKAPIGNRMTSGAR